MSPHQKYELAREQIRHEDGLINNRTTWFLVFQGLLFGTFFQALSLFEPKLLHTFFQAKLLVVALSVLCLLGAASALVAAAAVRAAYVHTTYLRDWWEKERDGDETLPKVMGTPRIAGFSQNGVSGAAILSMGASVWALLLVLLLWGAWV